MTVSKRELISWTLVLLLSVGLMTLAASNCSDGRPHGSAPFDGIETHGMGPTGTPPVQASPTRRRIIENTAKSNQEAPVPTWWKCFDEQDFLACLHDSLVSPITAEELSLAARRLEKSDIRLVTLVSEALTSVSPSEVAAFVDELYQSLGSDTPSQYILEAALAQLASKNHPWLGMIATSITPQDLFNSELSAGPVLMAGQLSSHSPAIEDILIEGAHGNYGGSDEQIRRALLACLGIFSHRRDSESAMVLFESIIESPNLPSSYEIGLSIAAFVTSPQFWPDRDPERAVALLTDLLNDSRFQLAAARQVFSEFAHSPPNGISEEDWASIDGKIRNIIGR